MRRSVASCVLLFAFAWTACDSDSPAGPTPPPAPVEATFNAASRGSVRSDGIVDTDANVGEGALNRAHQASLAFDLCFRAPAPTPMGKRIKSASTPQDSSLLTRLPEVS